MDAFMGYIQLERDPSKYFMYTFLALFLYLSYTNKSSEN